VLLAGGAGEAVLLTIGPNVVTAAGVLLPGAPVVVLLPGAPVVLLAGTPVGVEEPAGVVVVL